MSSLVLTSLLGPVALGFTWFLLPHLDRRRREAALARLCREGRIIVLSYDDGPGTGTTPALLDLLAARKVQASFFVLGRSAEARPDLVARLLAEGHEVGSHTHDHSNDWKTWPLRSAADRDAGVALIDRLGGDGRLFRPPYGKLTLAGWIAARMQRLQLAWWTLDSRDSWQRRPVEAVLEDIDAAGGGVVLMHDGDAYEKSGPGHAEYVLDLTGRIIDFAEAGGYRFLRMGALLDRGTARHG